MVENDILIHQKLIFFFINDKPYSIVEFNLSSLSLTKLILSSSNSLQITFLPKYFLNNFSIILTINGQFSYQTIQINDSINLIKFPSTDLYNISILNDEKEISSFEINVTKQSRNLFDSFFDCKSISNSLQCVISNACISSKGLSFFGYDNNIQMTNFSFVIDPMRNPEKLNVFAANDFNDHSFSNVTAIYADLQAKFGAFFHLVAETLFPFARLFDDYNLLNTSKIIVLKRKPTSILQYFPILNATVAYANENKCYKKLIIGFPRYDGYYEPRFNHYLDPDLFNYKYRKIWRSMHDKYFVQNKNDKRINVLFVNRPLASHRSILNCEQIISAIRSKHNDWNIVFSYFSNVSLYDQINQVMKADIFITLHGSAEVHMLLLNDDALMIEIMPYLLETFINLYRNIANLTKLNFIEFKTSRNSCTPRRRSWINEYESNPKVLCNSKFRSNIRNQNINLNETEINLMLNYIENHIQLKKKM